MRLVRYDEHGELGLTPDLSEHVPPYAILSHIWGLEKDEVSFQDMQSNVWTRKKGREKLDFCVEQAKKDGLRYFWIDTCCINKSNKMEVLDAIMSMFRWYANSEVCYVYMRDVTVDTGNACAGDNIWKTEFHAAKWFTRGWTLQELLAPKFVRFFSREGRDLGTKFSLLDEIHEVTTIPRTALCGTPLSNFTVAERMRWAAHRQTTKAEDRAYCLTGILSVFVVFYYGEEKHAYHRVLEAIVTKYRNSLYQLDRPPPQMVASFALRSSTLAPGQYRNELDSLDFDQNGSRRLTIKNAVPGTCTWLLDHPTYVQWSSTRNFQDHHGLLVLNGAPGSGKSTLMKFAYNAASQSRRENELTIPYFFNIGGTTLERSVSGMYRSLLVELMKQAPDLSANLENLSVPQANDSWSTLDLSRLFKVTLRNFIVLNYQAASKRKRVLKFFIDAIDECNEEEVREMVILFEEIGSEAFRFRTEVYVCFASRHYPTIKFPPSRRLILENENRADISEYLRACISSFSL